MTGTIARPALKTLVLPFERQGLAAPDKANPWLFLNAHAFAPPEHWPRGWQECLHCVQRFRPLSRELERHNLPAKISLAQLADNDYAGIMVLCGQSRKFNEYMIAESCLRARDGAVLLVAGEKTAGIAALKKWLAGPCPQMEVLSKHHAQVLSIHVTSELRQFMEQWPTDPQAGTFGNGKIDVGSQLLAETFGPDLKGHIADFCAGTGYLASQLVEKSDPQAIALLEADHVALDIAKDAFSDVAIPTTFHWLDLTSEKAPTRYDNIVMNPPFHIGRAADPALGKSIIATARKALKPRGRLRLVANRQLPYEQTLAELFGRFREVNSERGFKILEAQAPG